MTVSATLLETALDAAAAHTRFVAVHGHHGAVAAFTGVVRADPGVDHLWLDWYPGMTETSLGEIAGAAAGRFDVLAVTIVHRCGRVAAGEPVVFVAAASSHRRAAFDAVDYMMDRLKSEAALWKREGGPGGERWIEPTAADGETLGRWS